MSDNTKTCSNCKFYNAPYQVCHRYPPQIRFNDSGSAVGSSFPHSNPPDWCGEFKAIEPDITFITE